VDCERLAAATNAPVIFAGFINQREMPRVYAAADVIVVPSAHETWGLTVNEAMACGLPAIVTTGVGCSDDLVIPGQTGERFAVDDHEALVTRVLSLSRNPAYRHALGAGALQLIQRFTASAAAAGAVRALECVARRQTPRSRESVASVPGAAR
jgi:glycosyltransferase involved in cell wall biosynthesis